VYYALYGKAIKRIIGYLVTSKKDKNIRRDTKN